MTRATESPAPAAPSPVLQDPMAADTRRRLSAERIELLRRLARDAGGSAVWTTSRATVAWLTAGGQHHVVHASETGVAGLLVTADRAVLVSPTIERDRLVDEEITGLELEVETVPWFDPEGPAGAARRLAGAGLLDESDVGAGLVAARSVLDPADIERVAALGAVARDAVDATVAAIAAGDTEQAIAAALLGRAVGWRAPVVLVAADDRIARYRHPLPTARPVQRRAMVVLVAEAWGLHVALTRFAELDEPDAELAARWHAVRNVQDAMLEATVPGATLGEVLDAARRAYAVAGFPDEWRDHHQGGTIAYQGREHVATPGDTTGIEAGMALAWNPSIAGVKVEDTVVLEPGGGRRWVTRRAGPTDPRP